MGSKAKTGGAPARSGTDDRGDLELVEREVGAGAPQRLLTAGLECFFERGYYATTTRDIALRAGMSPGAMYIHYRSKGELLYRLSRIGHRDALRAVEESGGDAGDPHERLRRGVAAFADWHARHHRLARVSQYELRGVPVAHLDEIRELRHQVGDRIQAEVEAGIASGAFVAPEAHETVRAILSLCIDIARWYSPHGPRSPSELGHIYAELVIRMVAPTARPRPQEP